MRQRSTSGRWFRRAPLVAFTLAALLPLAVACNGDDDPVVVGPGDFNPEITDVRPIWVEEGWVDLEPLGTLAVQIFWELPQAWSGEVFEVYSRQAGSGDYLLIATVTSCIDRACTYVDTNVQSGESYDYFVVAVDERSNEELGESAVESVQVPAATEPEPPSEIVAIPLDNGVFLEWESVEAEKYRIFLEGVDDEELFIEVGATDGLGYVDTRAENGRVHTYRIASVAESGVVGSRSDAVTAIPRPDYHAELIYSTTDSAEASGFRFRETDGENPILAGNSADAQWRLEESEGALRIVPVGDTQVTEGIFTTALTCGPGSEADCEHVAAAPAASDFGTTPVAVSAGNTHVFQVTVDGETHFAKMRVQGAAEDSEGRSLVVFDWAYQLVPDEPSLNLSPVR